MATSPTVTLLNGAAPNLRIQQIADKLLLPSKLNLGAAKGTPIVALT